MTQRTAREDAVGLTPSSRRRSAPVERTLVGGVALCQSFGSRPNTLDVIEVHVFGRKTNFLKFIYNHERRLNSRWQFEVGKKN